MARRRTDRERKAMFANLSKKERRYAKQFGSVSWGSDEDQIHQWRSKRAKTMDESKRAKRVVKPGTYEANVWKFQENRIDFEGIDTPPKIKNPVSVSKKEYLKSRYEPMWLDTHTGLYDTKEKKRVDNLLPLEIRTAGIYEETPEWKAYRKNKLKKR